MKNLKECMRFLGGVTKPLAGKLSVSVVIGLVRIAASLSFVWACRTLVDIATGDKDLPISTYTWIMIGIVFVQILCNLAASYWENLIGVEARNDLRYKTFSHVLSSSWTGREEFHSGDVTNRLEEDIRVIVELVCVRFPDIVVTVCQLIAASIYLVNMAPSLLWLLLSLMVVGVLGSKMFFKTIRTLTDKIRKAESMVQQHMQENIQNRVLVLTLIGAGRVMEKLGLIQKDIRGYTVTRLNYNAVARGFMGFGFMAGYTSAFLWGVYGIKSGTVTFGMMTAFLQLVGQVQRPIADLSRHVPAFIHALTSEERIMELMELPIYKDEDAKYADGPVPIVFKNVSFSYPGGGREVLHEFSYTFEPGTLTAIMGPTGSGKSTLVRLAMGLLLPDSGSVNRYSKQSYMYVPQGNTLMSGTIRENLLLACPDASEERMREVLTASAAEFVLDLPLGLDTVCGEDGTGLSEGQSQRIAIARALLHEGGILVLDEATSALDSKTEDVLLERLAKGYRGEKTILFISHKEGICTYADSRLTLG